MEMRRNGGEEVGWSDWDLRTTAIIECQRTKERKKRQENGGELKRRGEGVGGVKKGSGRVGERGVGTGGVERKSSGR